MKFDDYDEVRKFLLPLKSMHTYHDQDTPRLRARVRQAPWTMSMTLVYHFSFRE